MNIWGYHEVERDKNYKAQIGPLILWLKKTEDEIHIAVERIQNDEVEIEAVSFSVITEPDLENLNWGRWIVGNDCNKILLLPLMPDRPVVVRPEVPVKIPKGHDALFFVNIPVWAKITVGNSEEVILCEEASAILSNIWFGDPMSGELCYSLRSRARRQIVDAEPKPHRAACPVRIRNTTKSQLDVDRFCVHVEHLNIYKGTKRLWANEVHINFQGEYAASKIDYIQKSPKYEDVDGILSKAKTPWKKTLLRRSLGKFKLLTGF